jgi:hypothetical protein
MVIRLTHTGLYDFIPGVVLLVALMISPDPGGYIRE